MLNLNAIIKRQLKDNTALFDELDAEITNRIIDNNVRIDNGKNGGVLWLPRGKEKKRDGNRCARSKFGIHSEVSLSRAMFNSRRQPLEFGPERIWLIAYEAPLLRKTTGRNSRSVSCDLVGLAERDQRLFAIEVKKKGGESTDLDYGLFEAAAYGFILAWYARRRSKELCGNIQSAIKRYHPDNAPVVDSRKGLSDSQMIMVQPVLACPRDYYSEQIKKRFSGIDGKDRLLRIEEQINAVCQKHGNILKLSFWDIPDNVRDEKGIPLLNSAPSPKDYAIFASLEELFCAFQ